MVGILKTKTVLETYNISRFLRIKCELLMVFNGRELHGRTIILKIRWGLIHFFFNDNKK